MTDISRGTTIVSLILFLAVIIMCAYMNHRISRDGIEGVDDINYF